jgi:major membrane immunogen (membrane-anchored lipoprotein)
MMQMIRVKLKRAWTIYPSKQKTEWSIDNGEYHIRACADDDSDGWNRVRYDEVDVSLGALVTVTETNKEGLVNREFYKVTIDGLQFTDCD